MVVKGLVASERDKDSGTGACPRTWLPTGLLRFKRFGSYRSALPPGFLSQKVSVELRYLSSSEDLGDQYNSQQCR